MEGVPAALDPVEELGAVWRNVEQEKENTQQSKGGGKRKNSPSSSKTADVSHPVGDELQDEKEKGRRTVPAAPESMGSRGDVRAKDIPGERNSASATERLLTFSLKVEKGDENEILSLVEKITLILEDNLHPFQLFEEWGTFAVRQSLQNGSALHHLFLAHNSLYFLAHNHTRSHDYVHDIDFDFSGSSNSGPGALDHRFHVPLGPGDRLGSVILIQQLESLFLQLCGFRRDKLSGALEVFPTTENMFSAGVSLLSL